jgi:RNA polymerase sigma-54 factor
MRFEASQHMRMGQHMKLAPRMIQSMEILQMPLAELEERIEQELENNPTLEIIEPGATADGDGGIGEGAADLNGTIASASADEPGADRQPGEDADSFERLEGFEASNPEAVENEFEERAPQREEPFEGLSRVRDSGEPDAKMEAMAAAPARQGSIAEQLRAQWGVVEVDESLRPYGEFIIDNLDGDGYLRAGTDELAERLPPALRAPDAPTKLERALKAVQLFLEPAGVGARDARECLLLQLDAIEDGDASEDVVGAWDGADDRAETIHTARLLASDFLDDLMNNRLPRIVERSGLSMDRIKQGLVLLRRLSLSPARRLAPEDAKPIVADGFIEYDEDQDRYYAYLNDNRLPNLQVNREYAKLTRDRSMPQRDREFIRTNVGNAQWLIEAVEQRKRTLLRVIEAVIDAQREYFDYGPQSLKPLPMTLVAEKLGIHVATVSRAVAEKYVMTPRGVVPLRGFFTGGTQTDTGEDVSWDAIKAALREVVDAEDKNKPLSDDALADALKARGLEIARRTVAKYREQLNIPTARLRKTF